MPVWILTLIINEIDLFEQIYFFSCHNDHKQNSEGDIAFSTVLFYLSLKH